MANNTKESIPQHGAFIPFADDDHRLTLDHIECYLSDNNKEDWCLPTLKFQSFKHGELALINIYEDRYYDLLLHVQKNKLAVKCGCGHRSKGLCIHAYEALYTLIWHMGEYYFKKLKPKGMMELAFVHHDHFDKEESIAGIDVELRPELRSVYALTDEKVNVRSLIALDALKSERKHHQLQPNGMAYLITISIRNKMMPVLLPCKGRLNKKGNDMVAWQNFSTAKNVMHGNDAFTKECVSLVKRVEANPGGMLNALQNGKQKVVKEIFESWKRIASFIFQYPLVYSYFYYGSKDLKKPAKSRVRKTDISKSEVSLEFVLLKESALYKFRCRAVVDGKPLSDSVAASDFFIRDRQTIYLLSSLRDAALSSWIHLSGGITIFKEHFALFEKEILKPLKQKYPVHIISPGEN